MCAIVQRVGKSQFERLTEMTVRGRRPAGPLTHSLTHSLIVPPLPSVRCMYTVHKNKGGSAMYGKCTIIVHAAVRCFLCFCVLLSF